MTTEDLMRAVRAAIRTTPDAKAPKTARDAQTRAALAARRAGTVLVEAIPAMGRTEVSQAVYETVHAVNQYALNVARRMQENRAAAYGEESLGVAEPAFNAARARNLVSFADTLMDADGAMTEMQSDALLDTIEQNARMCVDDAERDLADARYNMGKRAVIVRTAMGANSCEWCLSAAGEYEYGPAMDKAMAFGRHANCDCVIEYQPGDGRVETVRNYRRGG